MDKYVKYRNKSWYPEGDYDPYVHDFDGTPKDLTIYDNGVSDQKPTGILDKDGDMLCRQPNKIGFY